jgi:hypothetical protein
MPKARQRDIGETPQEPRLCLGGEDVKRPIDGLRDQAAVGVRLPRYPR